MTPAQFAGASLEFGRAVADGAATWSDALALLDGHVGGDVLSVSAMTLAEQTSADLVTRNARPLSAEELALWPELVGTHPYVPRLLGGPVEASRLTDTVELKAFERTELFQALLRPHGNRYQAGLVLQRDAHSMLLLSLWREDVDFTDRELEELERFRAVVAAAVAYRAAQDALLEVAGTEARRADLTPRQRQVAALVAAGLTNDQIARRLEITTRTVRKHVADTFVQTGVTSRAGLAAWWRQGGRSATSRS